MLSRPRPRKPDPPPPASSRSRTESRVAPSEGSFAQRNLSWLKRPRRRKECEQDSTCESPYGSEYGSDGEALGGRGSYGNLASSLSMSAAQRDPLTGVRVRACVCVSAALNMCVSLRHHVLFSSGCVHTPMRWVGMCAVVRWFVGNGVLCRTEQGPSAGVAPTCARVCVRTRVLQPHRGGSTQ